MTVSRLVGATMINLNGKPIRTSSLGPNYAPGGGGNHGMPRLDLKIEASMKGASARERIEPVAEPRTRFSSAYRLYIVWDISRCCLQCEKRGGENNVQHEEPLDRSLDFTLARAVSATPDKLRHNRRSPGLDGRPQIRTI